MIKSSDIQVQDFINQIMMTDKEKYPILEALRNIVFKIIPKAQERKMYGGIIFSLVNDFGGVFVYKNHVTFELGYGAELKDPEKILQGKGKYRRHLKFISNDKSELDRLDYFVHQIKKLESK